MTDTMERIDAALAPRKSDTSNPLALNYVPPSPPPKPRNDPPLFELTPEVCEAATVEERDAIITDLEKHDLLRLPFEDIAIRFPLREVSKQFDFRDVPAALMLTFYMRGAIKIDSAFSIVSDEPRTEGKSRWHSKEEMAALVASGAVLERRVVEPDQCSAYVYVSGRGPNGRKVDEWWDLNERDKEAPGFMGEFSALACEALTILLASLAVRNVVKDVRYNGRIGKGEGSTPIYEDNGVIYISRTVVRVPPASEMENDPDHPPRGQSKPHVRRGHEHTVVFGKGRTGRRRQWFGWTYVNYDPAFIPKPRKYLVRS